MKLLRGIPDISLFTGGSAVTIGNFDGVHIGHQHLIQALNKKAKELKIPSVVILFEPQPREYLDGANAPARLSSLREKLDLLRQNRIDYVWCIKFNRQMANTSAKEFVEHYLFSHLKAQYLLIGEDFRFGKDKTGEAQLLNKIAAKQGAEVVVFLDYCYNNERISSTKIRHALQQGDLQQAAQGLGRNYSICGRVIHGAQRGRQWGIPTANIGLPRLSLALHGVFVVQMAWHSQLIYGVANIGRRPTVDGSKNVLEVHLLHFDQSIYGELVQVFFLHKLRDEIKFTSVDALIAQIYNDIEATKTFVKNLTVSRSGE